MNFASNTLVLEATPLHFYSAGDDSAFSGWLDSLSCVEQVEGRGNVLYITINASQVDANNLRELLAIFFRYGFDMMQLKVFDCRDFSPWFQDPETYWHKKVFG